MPMRRRLLVIALAAATASCRSAGAPDATANVVAADATMTSDSAEYGVRLESGIYYRTKIGFTFVNETGAPLSRDYCRTPPPPVLEKKVDGAWVRAYDPIELRCLSVPPFRIAAGATYHGSLDVSAASPDRPDYGPNLEVASVAGTYRLRWVLRAGNDPTAEDAPLVQIVSNEFTLVER